MLVSSCLRTEKVFEVQYPGGVHRSMEDIKARYYAVARQLLVGREGTEDSVANNVLVKHPFNLTHERYCCFFAGQHMTPPHPFYSRFTWQRYITNVLSVFCVLSM